jgi:hypothetical protein
MRVPLPILAAVAVLVPACGDGSKFYPDPSSPAEEDGRPMKASQDPRIVTKWCKAPELTCGSYTWG